LVLGRSAGDLGRGSPRSAGLASPDSISSSLLDRVQGARPDAWERLVDLFGPEVYRWCRQSGLQADDAADVVQEVFSAVATHVAEFRRRRPGDSFRGWLWTITRNKIRDHFRRRQGQPQAAGGTDAQQQLAQIPAQPPDPDQTATTPPAGGDMEHRAMELVRAGVEERTWQAFWRVTVDGQAVADVAEELGMSVRAVYEAKYRVRRRIRQELADLID
jgi:RNA polymerase sigma-70 factor (ECF subfamily)